MAESLGRMGRPGQCVLRHFLRDQLRSQSQSITIHQCLHADDPVRVNHLISLVWLE